MDQKIPFIRRCSTRIDNCSFGNLDRYYFWQNFVDEAFDLAELVDIFEWIGHHGRISLSSEILLSMLLKNIFH